MLTLENDEYQSGIDDILKLKDKVGLVVDIHHHFVKSGEYLRCDDYRITHIVDSWCGTRPVFHYSQSKWEILQNYQSVMPTYEELLIKYKKSEIRINKLI